MRSIKKVNGYTSISDQAEGWSLKIPTRVVDAVIKTLEFSKCIEATTDEAPRRPKPRPIVRAPRPITPEPAAEPAEAAASKSKAKATTPAAEKKRGPGRPRRDGQPPGSVSKPPTMADILGKLASNGAVSRDAASKALLGAGFSPARTAVYLTNLSWDTQNNLILAN